MTINLLMTCIPLIMGWMLDLLFGDPQKLPHPIVGFGKIISFCECKFNKGNYRKIKGGLCAVILIAATYVSSRLIFQNIGNLYINILIQSIAVFYCLSGTTLIREVKGVFLALETGLESGRRQVARIVGRDTRYLSKHEVQTAALETLAENLSDGVVAPIFWYALLGVPGMLAYKMTNTLDSMIGYRTVRYKEFGYMAAKIDDIANYLPARITSALMVLVCARPRLFTFVKQYGNKHLSSNSGYPESALAGILDCQFGGPHDYFGQTIHKPYIGANPRELTTMDMELAIRINRKVEFMAILIVLICRIGIERILI